MWLRHSFVIDHSFVPQRQQEQFYDEIEGKRSLARRSRQRPSRSEQTHRAASTCANMPHQKYTFFFLLVASFGWQRRRQSGLLGHVPIRLYPVNHVAAFTVLHIHYMYLAPWAAVRIESSPVSLTFAEGLSPPGALSRRRTRVTFQHFLCALFRFDFLE